MRAPEPCKPDGLSPLLSAGACAVGVCNSHSDMAPCTPSTRADPAVAATVPNGAAAACSLPLAQQLALAAALAQLPPAEVLPVPGGYMVVRRCGGGTEEQFSRQLRLVRRLCNAHRALPNGQFPSTGPEARLLAALHEAAAANRALAASSLQSSLRLHLLRLHQRARLSARSTARSLAEHQCSE